MIIFAILAFSMLFSLRSQRSIFFCPKYSALQALKFFIERGVQPSYTDILNQTVLFYAAREGKTNCIDLLLKQGKSSCFEH